MPLLAQAGGDSAASSIPVHRSSDLDASMSGYVPETPARARKSLPVMPMSVPNRIPETPGSRLPVRKSGSVSVTPRHSVTRVLGESQRENLVPVLPRNRSMDHVAKAAEARLDELRHEKFMLVNERENLKTEIQLGRQRELKLKAQVDKLEALNSRYKERATTYNRIEAQRGLLVREQDAVIAQLQRAQDEATQYALQCIELTGELDELKLDQNEIATHIREQSRQYMHSVANVAMQWAREKYTLSETLRDARKRIDTLQYASTSKDLMINTIEQTQHDLQDHIHELYAERDTLMCSLQEAHQRILQLEQRDISVADEFTEEGGADIQSELAHTYAWKMRISESDAVWYAFKHDSSEARCAWLEKALAHTQTMHSKVLSALFAEKSARKAEQTPSLLAELDSVKKREEKLEAENAHLSQQLDLVTWYKDAYNARTEQTQLLKSLLEMHSKERLSLEESRDPNAISNTHTAWVSLDMRIDLLRQEQNELEARRHGLERHARQIDKHISAYRQSSMHQRRSSDSAILTGCIS